MSDIHIRVIDFETSDLPERGGVIIEAAWGQVSYDPSTRTPLIHSVGMARYGLPEGRKIDPAAQAMHHIWPHELDYKTPFQTGDALALVSNEEAGDPRPGPDYIAAHNAQFEQDMLGNYTTFVTNVTKFICTEKCARHIFPNADQWNLQYLRYYLQLEGNRGPMTQGQPAHSAVADVCITQLLLATMLEMGKSPEELFFLTNQPVHYPRCPIGKYKGQPWSEVDTGMLNWMLYKAADMDPDIKAAARNELFFRNGR